MTASAVSVPGIRRIVSSTPANTNEATLFTAKVPQAQTTVVEIWITNLTGTAADATLKWGDGSTDYSLIDTESVASRSRIGPIACLIPLRKDYTIKITSGTGNALTFTIVVVEQTGSAVGEHTR